MATEPTQPFPIVYMIGVVILDIAIILSAMTYLADINIQQHYDISNLKYSVRAARLLNSPACFAYESSYVLDGKTVYQVEPAVINLSKFVGGIPNECSQGESIHLELQKIDSTGNAIGSPEIIGATIDSSWNKKNVTYFVIVDDAGTRTGGLLKYNMKL